MHGLSGAAGALGENFVSRGAMDIEGLGIRQAELFVEQGLVRDVADIYGLDPDQIRRMEGYADKRVANLMAAIEASKRQSRRGC
jgi:DNA ligase (NAD+)